MFSILLQSTSSGLSCIWWWLFSLLAFLLGWLLDWLLFGRSKDTEIERLRVESDNYHKASVKWEGDYSNVRYQLEEAQKEIANFRTSLQRCEADKAVLNTKLERERASKVSGTTDEITAAATGLVVGKLTDEGDDDTPRGIVGTGGPNDRGAMYADLFQEDNLQIIEGIGPKIERLLHDRDIRTWSQLATASVDDLQAMLDEAGRNYRLARPESWPHQAKLAADGAWEKLIEYQKFLDTGRETTGDLDNPAKLEKLFAKAMGYSTNPEDLKVVEGIGPKIEQLLKDAGIKTWSDLANADLNRLRDILAEAGDRYKLANPETWARQANLAAQGDWDELTRYQETLNGGKE